MTLGVCGLGQMGLGVTLSARRAGFHVLVHDRDPEKLRRVKERLGEMDTWMGERLGTSAKPPGEVVPCPQVDPINSEAEIVFEAITEDLSEKVKLFRRLAGCIRRGGVVATITSGLSISEMDRLAGCDGRLVGAHFWNPAHLMPLVEVVRGGNTRAEAMDRVVGLVEALGKVPVRVNKDVPGFVGNRMLHALWREALALVEQGVAGPQEVDLVAKLTFGLRMPAVGPLENMDLVGLDLIKTIQDYLLTDLADNHAAGNVLSQRVEQKQLGMKTGRGFYDWTVRNPTELIEKRDRQIVEQLQKLRES